MKLSWYIASMEAIENTEPNPNQSEYALHLIGEIRRYARRAREYISESEEYKMMILRGEEKDD